MPGSASNVMVRRIFGTIPMPASMKQLDETLGPGNQGLAPRIIHTRISLDIGVLADGDEYWMTDEVMAEGVAIAEKEIAEWQEYLQYLQTQRTALAARGLPIPIPDR